MDYMLRTTPSNYESVTFERSYSVKYLAWGPQVVTSVHFEVNLGRSAPQIHFKVRTCDRLGPPSKKFHIVRALKSHAFIIRWVVGLSIIIHFTTFVFSSLVLGTDLMI